MDVDPSAKLVRHRGTRIMWGAAFALALALHAGGLVAALLDMRAAAADDEMGAPAIEVGIELASPQTEPTDLPPGPESEASTASTAQVEQKQVEEQSDKPKDTPVESEDPDRVVSTAPTEKPKEETEAPATRASQASEESAAAEATAPPVIEKAQEAPVSRAPVQGTGASASRVRTTWQRQLVAHLDRHKRYPAGGKRAAHEVLISFTLDRTGKVVATAIARSSGEPAFDEAALAMMRRADPVPAPPPLVADEGLTFTVPVVFRQSRR
ncbi:TonB family protein [Enterovirga sp.]|uniref:energy transducer TonB family protein n=1 Tax=Enterovirga sp. TaxID=2026350 RepID=UPI002CE0E150|nr:TonB family protein [Enterovirga sp.]HMO29204.1 TonB family protein [Enterovirga sp.]